MKRIFLIILIFLSKSVIAQSNNKPYIYDSKLEIGHIKLMEYPNSRIFFHEYRTNIDTLKNHKDDYSLIVKFAIFGDLMNRIIILTFDGPVDYCELKCPNNLSHTTTIPNKDNTEYKFIINKLATKELSFVILSKEKIYVKINEVSKYITP